MIKIFISPSKTMKESYGIEKTLPRFIEEAKLIRDKIINLPDIQKSLHLSDKILQQTIEEYKNIKFDLKGQKAIESYAGLQFKNIDYINLDVADKKYIDENLFIYSALYGLNKATDSIYRYRLDFSADLNLYEFWREKITHFMKDNIILDVSSNEFAKIVDTTKVKEYYRVFFKEEKKGVVKSFSTSSKIMRGKLIKYLALNKIDNIEDVKKFKADGFKYFSQSNTKELIFKKLEEK